MSSGVEFFQVDCEARGPSPVSGTLTEFGVVHQTCRETFHGVLWESVPDPENPAVPLLSTHRAATDGEVARALAAWLEGHLPRGSRPVMVSDNPAFDFMWIAGMHDRAGLPNPFGHSARRISDFAAGLERDWRKSQGWKRLRRTPHDHNPVHDAMGNAEALAALLSRADADDAAELNLEALPAERELSRAEVIARVEGRLIQAEMDRVRQAQLLARTQKNLAELRALVTEARASAAREE